MARSSVILIRNAAPQDFGGGERFPVFLAQELQQADFQPLILSRHRTLLAYAKDQGVSHRRTWWWSQQNWSGRRVMLFPIYLVWQLLLTFYYITLFLRYRVKVVHLQSRDDFIAGSIAGRLVGARVIWTDHADLKHIWRHITVWYRNPVGKLVALAGRLAHTITVVSQSEQQLVTLNLSSHSPLRTKIIVVYNGVEDRYNTYTHDTHDVFTFCIAGRLVIDKGVGEAIEAFRYFQAHHPKSQLLLIGDGPDRVKFEQQAKGLPIHFLGHQTDPLPEVARADVYLHPTYHEGFSISLIEASMLGLAIIATKVGGNPEIIHHQKTGLLILVKDSAALTEAMERLYNNPSLRLSLGRAARQQFTELFVFRQIVAKKFIPLYNRTYEDSH